MCPIKKTFKRQINCEPGSELITAIKVNISLDAENLNYRRHCGSVFGSFSRLVSLRKALTRLGRRSFEFRGCAKINLHSGAAPGGQMQGAATQTMRDIVEERRHSRCPPRAAPRRAAIFQVVIYYGVFL